MAAQSVSIVKVRDLLLVTVPAEPDDETVGALQVSVLEAVEKHEPRGLIMDISTVQTLDSFFARVITETVRMVEVMGGRTVITGMSAEVAVTATQLGLSFGGTPTALDVDRALDMFDLAGAGGG
jgi:rsbT antagonist protein RsbS